jgi:hypothetical protein
MGADGKFTSSWVRYSCGSTSCRRQVLVRLANIDAVRPPRGLPTNNEFLRFNTTRLISRSLTLLSMGTARSRQKVSPQTCRRLLRDAFPNLRGRSEGFPCSDSTTGMIQPPPSHRQSECPCDLSRLSGQPTALPFGLSLSASLAGPC